jgi:hypothetical protein
MTAIAAGGGSGGRGGFAPFHTADRGFFLAMTALVWLGIVAGFGSDMARHIQSHEAAYPLIVHFHAAVMVSWLLLFTTQVGLIRAGRADLHRRLGVFAIALAVVMVVIGPATAVVVDTRAFDTQHRPPTFLAIQFEDMIVFAILVGAAFLWRRTAAVHKRLMMLSLVNISDAGFARWQGDAVEAWLGKAYFPEYLSLYLGTDILLLGFGVYDYVTRKRLHPAYVAGAALIVAGEATAAWLWHAPFWLGVSTQIIGR